MNMTTRITAIAAAVEGFEPRARVRTDLGSTRFTEFAGLETLTIRPDSNFQMVGERTGAARRSNVSAVAATPTNGSSLASRSSADNNDCEYSSRGPKL